MRNKRTAIAISMGIKEAKLQEFERFVVLALLALVLFLISCSQAMAFTLPSLTGISTVLCNAAYIMIIDVARGIASIAVIAIGVAALLGKATWAQAISVGVGIGVVFGAIPIVTALTLNAASIVALGALPALPCAPGGT